MNGNWSEDNRKRRVRCKGGERDQFTSDVLFSYPSKGHASIFKPHPKR